MKEKYVDLHVHSANVDGALTPKEILREAKKNNVGIISITDHDFIPHRNFYKSVTIHDTDIKLIPGAELSTDYYIGDRKVRIHLMAYDAIDKDGILRRELEKKKAARFEGNYAYIQMLLKKFKFLSPGDFEGFDYARYGWLHKRILSYLDLNKYDKEDVKLLKRCLKEIKPIYPKCTFEIEEGIGIVKDAKGVTSFAHPYRTKLRPDEMEALVDKMKVFGLDSIETIHSEATKAQNDFANQLADEHKLFKSCASDFHEFDSTGKKIGLGINGNMKVNHNTLSDYLVEEGKYFINGEYKGESDDYER